MAFLEVIVIYLIIHMICAGFGIMLLRKHYDNSKYLDWQKERSFYIPASILFGPVGLMASILTYASSH